MNPFEKFLNDNAWRFSKGYPDMQNNQDILLLESLIQGLGIDFKFDQLIFEAVDSSVKKNTKAAIDFIVKNTSKGFKTQSDDFRLGNPEQVSPEEVQQIFKELFTVDGDITVHGPRSGPNPSGKFDMYEFETEEFGPVRIARFHNIFGPQGTWKGGKEKAPAAMCRKVAETPDGGVIEVWGDGKLIHRWVELNC